MKLRYQKLSGVSFSPMYNVWAADDTTGNSLGTVERLNSEGPWVATGPDGRTYYSDTRASAAAKLPGARK